MSELAYTVEEEKAIARKSRIMLMVIAVISIVMLFAAFCSAYIVRKSDDMWVNLVMPQSFYYSCYIIIASSITFYLALKVQQKGKNALSKLLVFLTLFLGIGFVYTQIQGWKELSVEGNVVVDTPISILVEKAKYYEDYTITYKGVELVEKNGFFYDPMDVAYLKPLNESIKLDQGNAASSYFYVITFIHVVHLLFGIASLLFVFIKSIRNKYSSENTLGMQVSGIYWHFLGILWLYLFVFLGNFV